MAITTIYPVVADVMFMRKLYRLLPRNEGLRDIRRAIEVQNERQSTTCD
jgi:hypothetical protein